MPGWSILFYTLAGAAGLLALPVLVWHVAIAFCGLAPARRRKNLPVPDVYKRQFQLPGLDLHAPAPVGHVRLYLHPVLFAR